MHRQLLRQEPEVIAVVAKHEGIFKRWQKENDFYDLPNIKWRYVRGKYSIMGIRFTMIFLLEDWYRQKGVGKLVELIHRQLDKYTNRGRTFTTEEMQTGRYKYRQTATGGSLPYRPL